MDYYAHSGSKKDPPSKDKSDWQSLPCHLNAVAEAAAASARPFGLDKAAFVLGLFHDLGKYDPAFQKRLEGACVRVDHSTAGAVMLKTLTKGADIRFAELLMYAVLGHHAGLPDMLNGYGHCFDRRIKEHKNRLDPVWQSQLEFDLTGLIPSTFLARISSEPSHRAFDYSVVTRFLFSCLVDADYRDTQEHYSRLEGWVPDRHWPSLETLLPEFTARFDACLAAKPRDGDVNALRREVLAHVRARAAAGPGVFTLTVPTGGGKTLAVLGFALDHAQKNGHHRIIFAIPFTSVVDQVAKVFGEVLGEENILVHHSAIETEEGEGDRDDRRFRTSRDRMKLAMEDWAAPVVVTTNVQFFESLFAARTTRARKLHNIAGSIIILDEAQTIPRHLLQPCVRMLDSLARLFDCTIVLCTATQPALGRPAFPGGLDLDGRELAPDPVGLFQRMRRTRIVRVGAMDNAALVEAIGAHDQTLVIVNTRQHALDLYCAGVEAGLEGMVHLTTRQCLAHRRGILADIQRRLDPSSPQPCRVIATSLIEAGIDLDFRRVWRAETGLDGIVQAAGRANREGRFPWEESIVTVFSADGYPLPSAFKPLVAALDRTSKNHEDLGSLAAIERFFREAYWGAGLELDSKGILAKFNYTFSGSNFAFRQVAEDFRMIETNMGPVIIPYDETARRAIAELAVEKIPSGVIARKLQGYVVQVPPKARDMLISARHVAFAQPDVRERQFAVLHFESIGVGPVALYNEERGLLWDTPEYKTAENMI